MFRSIQAVAAILIAGTVSASIGPRRYWHNRLRHLKSPNPNLAIHLSGRESCLSIPPLAT